MDNGGYDVDLFDFEFDIEIMDNSLEVEQNIISRSSYVWSFFLLHSCHDEFGSMFVGRIQPHRNYV